MQQRERVLVVDDSVMTTQAVAILLRRLGFEPITATSGHCAISICSGIQPVAGFIDLCLPDMSGCEVVQQLRNLTFRRRPKLFAITALPEHAARSSALAAGFDDLIAKPFGREELERALRIASRGDARRST